MYTHEQVYEMFETAKSVCKHLSIPITDNFFPYIDFPKAHSFYGYCRRINGRFLIRISEYALGGTEKGVMNTIFHELLHTCPGCMNHGPEWRKYAKIINDAYGYHIQRCDGDKTAQDKMSLKANSSRPISVHKIVCEDCGKVWHRTRHSNLTLHPERYHCKCGGRIHVEY